MAFEWYSIQTGGRRLFTHGIFFSTEFIRLRWLLFPFSQRDGWKVMTELLNGVREWCGLLLG